MANILIRDLDDEVVRRLKESAKENGRSLQAEIHQALETASVLSMARTRRLSEKWLKRLRKYPQTSDSTDLIREDRER